MTNTGILSSHKYLVDGVPVFHVPRSGPTTMGLVFRVGQADETLPQRGITHLIEHLALAEISGLFSFNGVVEPVATSFVARGTADEAAEFVQSVIANLGSLPYDRLAVESTILRTEGNARSAGGVGHVLSLLFGPAGYGLPGYPELVLERPDMEALERWRVAHFTRDNAAVWIAGSLPSGLDLGGLPPGKPRRAPAAHPVLPPNAHLVEIPTEMVMVASVLPRALAANMLLWVLEQRLRDRLRKNEGISYSVVASRENMGAHHTFCTLRADCLPQHAHAVHSALRSELTRLSTDGPTQEELSTYQLHLQRYFADPANATKEAAQMAVNHLVGYPHRGPERLLAAVAKVKPVEVAGAAAQLLRRAFWLVPDDAQVEDASLVPVPLESSWKVTGTQHLAATAQPGACGPALTIAPGQIGWTGEQGESIAIDLHQVEAMLSTADGRRVIWANDGFLLEFQPEEWLAGQEILVHLDASVPPARRVAADSVPAESTKDASKENVTV